MGQSNPGAKTCALEAFLMRHPKSVRKEQALDALVEVYQATFPCPTLTPEIQDVEVDTDDIKAIFISVFEKKSRCLRTRDVSGTTSDVKTCDDAAILARKGLIAPRPAGYSDDDWRRLIANTYPLFHSTIALDEMLSKKNLKAAAEEYRQELMLCSDDDTKRGLGLVDTLQLAETYARMHDAVNAIWFYARTVNLVPDSYKGQVEMKLDYWYKRYHGGVDGLDRIKSQAATSLFPPTGLTIEPAQSPRQR